LSEEAAEDLLCIYLKSVDRIREAVELLRRFLELLEPDRQPVSIGTVFTPPRQLDHLPDDPLQPEFEERAIMQVEQPSRRRSGVHRRPHDGASLTVSRSRSLAVLIARPHP
jgi:hypothetical protein